MFSPGSEGAEKVKPLTGSYKQILKKAEEMGKPVMIDFYTDWCGWCKVMDSVVQQIPDTMEKVAYYKVNAERDTALAKQFAVHSYPTVVFVKPDGSEFHRWNGAYQKADDLRRAVEQALGKAGDIEPQKPKATTGNTATATTAQKSGVEAAAANELKSAQQYINVGRKNDAVKALRQIISKYPNSEAAGQAREKLEELTGKN